jgi:hypothetical protein
MYKKLYRKTCREESIATPRRSGKIILEWILTKYDGERGLDSSASG